MGINMNDSNSQLPGIAPVLRRESMPEKREAIQVPIPNWDAGAVPGIKVNKENDVVRSIEITCSCGQTMQIVCDYEHDLGTAAQV